MSFKGSPRRIFFNANRGMKIISVNETPAELFGEQPADSSLA